MKIKFTKGGCFTTEGKVVLGDIVSLDSDEANEWMQKGFAVPAEDLVSTEDLEINVEVDEEEDEDEEEE